MSLFGKKATKREQKELIKTVKNSDRGKKQAKKELKSLMEKKDPAVLRQIAKTRVQLYSQAAYEGDGQAQYRMGISLAKLGEKEMSLDWLTGLAKKGDIKAMKAIARGYGPQGIYGYSRQEYRHWTQKAAEAGDAQAQADLGALLAGKDEKQSRYWYKQSAMQSCPAGCIGLGKACYNEALRYLDEEERDRRQIMLERAEECFLRAADAAKKEEDFAVACHELGVLYEAMAGEKRAEADSPRRAAYFYWQAWKTAGSQEDMNSLQRVREHFDIKADPAEMEKWREEFELPESS